MKEGYEVHELSWQLYTKTGNQQMQGQLYCQAQQSYSRAMEIAKLMLESAKADSNHPDAIHPLVVSHHNLADVYLNLGSIQQAESTLQQGYAIVIAVMNDANLPSSLRLESFKALKMVTFEISQFYQDRDQFEQAKAVFIQATQQAQGFLVQFDLTSQEELPAHSPIPDHHATPN